MTTSGPVPETPITLTDSSYPGGTAPGYSPDLDSIAITPDGHTLYVADLLNGYVIPIDLTQSTPAFGQAISVGEFASALAVSSAGSVMPGR